MYSHVPFQVGVNLRSIVTQCTHIGGVTCMRTEMYSQLTRVPARIWTDLTPEEHILTL